MYLNILRLRGQSFTVKIRQNTAAVDNTARSIHEKWGGDIIGAFHGEFSGYFDDLMPLFEQQGFKVDRERLTVWIMYAGL